MELKDKLFDIEKRIKENEKQFEGLERKEVFEEQEEELYWLSGKGNKLNEEMWYYFRGSKATRFFDEADQGLLKYRNSIRVHFDDKYQEINSRKKQLHREQEALRDSYYQVKEKLRKEEGEK